MWTEEQMASALQRKEAEQNLTSTSLILVSVKGILNNGPTHGILPLSTSSTQVVVKVPTVYVICQDVDVLEYVLFEDKKEDKKEEQHMYQMPLSAENFNRDIKLVYNILKAACVNQDYVKVANGRKALVAQSCDDGTGELNNHIHCVLAL